MPPTVSHPADVPAPLTAVVTKILRSRHTFGTIRGIPVAVRPHRTLSRCAGPEPLELFCEFDGRLGLTGQRSGTTIALARAFKRDSVTARVRARRAGMRSRAAGVDRLPRGARRLIRRVVVVTASDRHGGSELEGSARDGEGTPPRFP